MERAPHPDGPLEESHPVVLVCVGGQLPVEHQVPRVDGARPRDGGPGAHGQVHQRPRQGNGVLRLAMGLWGQEQDQSEIESEDIRWNSSRGVISILFTVSFI